MEEKANLNPQVLHAKIITFRDNVKTSNNKLIQQMSGLDEYYTTTCNQIWGDFDSLVQLLKQQVQQLTLSLKQSTEAVKKNFEERIEDNNLYENDLETLALKLAELPLNCPTNSEEEEKSTSCVEVESKCKSLQKRYAKKHDKAGDLYAVRVEYESEFIDMYKKIPSMVIGNIYLSKDMECAPLSIEKSNNEAKQTLDRHCPPKLVPQTMWLIDEIDWISGITVTDNDHVFLCDRWNMNVKEYSSDGKFFKCYDLPNEPWDICSISSTTIFVMMAWDYQLALLEKSFDTDSYQVSKIVSTDKRYVSVCLVGSEILASDRHTNIDILSPEGNLLRSISIPALGEGMQWYPHRVSPGISTDTFLLLNWDIQSLLCYTFEETFEFSHDLKWGGESEASAVCLDKKGRIYVCDKYRLYSLSPERALNILLTFEKGLDEDPRIFVCNRRDFLYLSCYEDGNKYLKIFKISGTL